MFPRALLVSVLALACAPSVAIAHDELITHSDTPAELAGASIARAVRAAGNTGAALPTSWCGSRLTVDDTLDAAQPPLTPVVKVVYAYASDQTDRSALWANALQANVSTIQTFLAQQSGGRRALSFDMGTSCGPEYVDITVVPLPRARTQYAGNAGFGSLRNDVRAALGTSAARRDVLILADQLNDWIFALGEVHTTDDRPDAANSHNDGGLAAAIYSTPGSTPGTSGWQPSMMLHEISHNLGAVQSSAPHSTPNGHCWDGQDVMCYDDGSTGSQPYTGTACRMIAGVITQVYDCGHDDYYNPVPTPGSYLDTHWNVYRSVFMASCTSLGSACGSLSRPIVMPLNATPPGISGDPVVGGTLTASPGAWLGAPTSYATRWERETSPGTWQSVAGVTFAYPITATDEGHRLRVTVIATNDDGSAAATSDPSAAIVAAPPPPLSTPPAPMPNGETPAAPLPPVPLSPVAATDTTLVTSPPSVYSSPAGDFVAPLTLRLTLTADRHRAGVLRVPVTRSARGAQISSTPATVAAAAGRWRLKLCAAATGQPRRCALGPRAQSVHGRVRLAAVRVLLRTTSERITVTAALVGSSARPGARGTASTA